MKQSPFVKFSDQPVWHQQLRSLHSKSLQTPSFLILMLALNSASRLHPVYLTKYIELLLCDWMLCQQAVQHLINKVTMKCICSLFVHNRNHYIFYNLNHTCILFFVLFNYFCFLIVCHWTFPHLVFDSPDSSHLMWNSSQCCNSKDLTLETIFSKNVVSGLCYIILIILFILFFNGTGELDGL